jgi:hypothetical protein
LFCRALLLSSSFSGKFQPYLAAVTNSSVAESLGLCRFAGGGSPLLLLGCVGGFESFSDLAR